MNAVVVRLTFRSLMGRRRGWLLAVLPSLLLPMAVLQRATADNPAQAISTIGNGFAMALFLPLICLLIGTGVIGPEIEDQSLFYLLSKPIRRTTVAASKLVVGYWAAFALAVVPTMLAVIIAGDADGSASLRYGVAAAVASVLYVTVFFALAVTLRSAVITGLIYALLWESTLATWVPGVRNLSIRRWAESIGIEAAGATGGTVGFGAAVTLSVIAAVGAIALSVWKLNRLRFRDED